jgi:PIF1-like helicase/Helix-turn-helix domain/HRDC domain
MTISNPELQLADSFIQDTNCHLFLTGKAGTGKTTFLHQLRRKTHKRMVVTAPTGVAAINAGGMTLHSFFQMPFGPFILGSEYANNQRRFSKDKINIIRSLDLLVIDEISMVRSDLLDGIDDVLRRLRRSSLPFGGVQLLMIGDLHQLSPVIKEAEWDILNNYYDSAYFFDSMALGQTELVTIELQHIYRQSDSRFIEILNRVRDNRLDPPSLQALNSRFIPDFKPPEGCITLCTHNRKADEINASNLQALDKKLYRFSAVIEGDFPEHSYPTALDLELKVGAQVMFVKNDPSPEKLYFNGKIGKITRIFDDIICIRCPDDNHEIEVEPTIWDNIEYKIDPATSEIRENRIGTFGQFPLKPAWAITIHKSQGLTFDRAVIDARAAFAHGQVYVALSRCRTFEGLVLGSPLSANVIKSDATVRHFIETATKNPPSADKLQAARITYQQQLLGQCFDFQPLLRYLQTLVRMLVNFGSLVQASGVGDIQEVEKRIRDEVCTIGENFRRQLSQLLASNDLPETDPAVIERTDKASIYFQDKLEATLLPFLAHLQVDTDNKEIRKRLKKTLVSLQEETAIKLAAVLSCRGGFSPARYLHAVATASIDLRSAKTQKPTSPDAVESDIAHPDLFQSLKDWRGQKASEQGIPHFQVMHQKTLIQIAVNMPANLPALLKIKGIGPRLAEKYGKDLITIVTDYRRENDIQDVPAAEAVETEGGELQEKRAKVDTRQTSLDMFEKGMTITQISEQRGLVQSTIEGHLAFWIERGELNIDRVVPRERQKIIGEQLAKTADRSLKSVKETLGRDYSYGEIKMILAHLSFRKTI